jgi:hypothetical protein
MHQKNIKVCCILWHSYKISMMLGRDLLSIICCFRLLLSALFLLIIFDLNLSSSGIVLSCRKKKRHRTWSVYSPRFLFFPLPPDLECFDCSIYLFLQFENVVPSILRRLSFSSRSPSALVVGISLKRLLSWY